MDTQDHLGFDLAVTKHYPVEAANHGIVLFAGYLGIYGNTVILDHGYGLLSLYAHMSSIEVKVGDAVTIEATHLVNQEQPDWRVAITYILASSYTANR